MHHVALDRAGPDDRDLDDEVVVRAGPQPRQHRHLRARLDLEHAHRVGVADHVVDRRVFGGHGRECPALAAAAVHEVERAADRGEHAEPEHVDLEQAERIEVVLVPLDHGAVGHRGVLDGNEFFEQVARDDESADVLREVARKPEQGPCEGQYPCEHRTVGIQAGFTHAGLVDARAVPPLHRAREGCDLQRVESHRLRHVAQRAARPVADDRCSQRSPLAAVLGVDVLDDFFTPLVLEVDVDVRRFVALPGNEALEQQRHAPGIDFGDAETEAHRRVGRRAATLAENVPRAREPHDVVHGEEVRLVLELGDQRELVLDRLSRRGRHAFRPAVTCALLREAPQPCGRRVTFRHDLARIFVTQFLERERAARGDLHRSGEQLGRMQLRDALERAQVTLTVLKQREPRPLDGGADAGCGEHVLQRAAAARVHVRVPGRDERQFKFATEVLQLLEPPAIAARRQQFDRDPELAGEERGEPACFVSVGLRCGQPQAKERG